MSYYPIYSTYLSSDVMDYIAMCDEAVLKRDVIQLADLLDSWRKANLKDPYLRVYQGVKSYLEGDFKGAVEKIGKVLKYLPLKFVPLYVHSLVKAGERKMAQAYLDGLVQNRGPKEKAALYFLFVALADDKEAWLGYMSKSYHSDEATFRELMKEVMHFNNQQVDNIEVLIQVAEKIISQLSG